MRSTLSAPYTESPTSFDNPKPSKLQRGSGFRGEGSRLRVSLVRKDTFKHGVEGLGFKGPISHKRGIYIESRSKKSVPAA